MFEVKVTNNRASTTRGELLTKGQIGAQVQFAFNDHWADMKKTAVFKRCGKTIDVMDTVWNGDIVTVPPEMTEEAGLLVYVGVYGVSADGKRITPTIYAPLGVVALSAEPAGDSSTSPTLPVWAQLQNEIQAMLDATKIYYVDLDGSFPNYTYRGNMGDIKAAYESGKVLYCRCKIGKFIGTLPLFIPIPNEHTWIFSGAGALTSEGEALLFNPQMLTVAVSMFGVSAQITQLMPVD